MAGGVLLETGAGGSAPKHVEQLLKENHLRWDSLGEYLATAIGFQELGARTNSANSTLLGDTLMNAVGKWLDTNKTPGRKVNQIDNRGKDKRFKSICSKCFIFHIFSNSYSFWPVAHLAKMNSNTQKNKRSPVFTYYVQFLLIKILVKLFFK